MYIVMIIVSPHRIGYAVGDEPKAAKRKEKCLLFKVKYF